VSDLEGGVREPPTAVMKEAGCITQATERRVLF
jgi:hypothetical protein